MGSKNGISGREVQWNAEISRRVEEMRIDRRISKIEMARAMDITPQMLRAYHVGATRWPVYRLAQAAALFGVSVDDFMPEIKSCVKHPCVEAYLRLL